MAQGEEEDKEDEEPIVETIMFLQGVPVFVSAVKNQGLCGSSSAFFVSWAVGLQRVLTSGGHRVDPTAQWISCLLHLCFSTFLVYRGVHWDVAVVVGAVKNQWCVRTSAGMVVDVSVNCSESSSSFPSAWANCAENRQVFTSAVHGYSSCAMLGLTVFHAVRQLLGFERISYVKVVLGS